MPKKLLIIGSDLNTQKLLVDILELTYSDVTIDKMTNTEVFDSKLKDREEYYNLIIIDCFSSKNKNEDIIMNIRKNYPCILNNLILLIDSLEGKPDSNILYDIPYIIKPFSLDAFGELLDKVCIK